MTVLDPKRSRKPRQRDEEDNIISEMEVIGAGGDDNTNKNNNRLKEGEVENEEQEEVDPFTHKLELTPWQWIRTFIFTFTVLPLRFLATFLVVLTAYLVSSLALLNLSKSDLQNKPMVGRRRFLRDLAARLGRAMMFCIGFHSVTVKGRKASPSEAPIFVAAPHSTFFDAIAAFWADLPYLVNREENRSIPFFGKCIECTQALFVSREDPDSRQKTIREIIRRANSPDPWPQLIIFPEGSTSNRKALMKFKSGAFLPGKSVQPVVIRYPNELDTVTWTWNQSHGALKVIWLTMTQPFLKAEVEFLPVYHPSEEEVKDAALYARNVREVMARALGVPTRDDATFEEAKAKFGKKKNIKKEE